MRVPLVCLFLSGAAGLIYEVVWTRLLCLVFGSTVQATSTVFGVFFAGLALGSLLFGGVADRMRRPLVLYAVLEGALGVYGLASPVLIRAVNSLELRLADPAAPSGSVAVRVLLSFVMLLLPTILMGGTFPAACRHFIRNRKEAGKHVGRLYAVNTLGAVGGTLLAGFVLIRLLGLNGSLIVAAGLNFLVALACLVVASPVDAKPAEDTPAQAAQPSRPRLVLVFFFVCGMTSLGYEVAWTRSLNFFFGSSVYSLTLMLAAFLTGLAAGSLVYSGWSPLKRASNRGMGAFGYLGRLQIRIALSAVLFLAVLMVLPKAYILIVQLFGGRFFAFQLAQYAVIFVSMLYTTLTFGIAFPAAGDLYLSAGRRTGKATGLFYAVNTAGALLGAIAAGFFLISRIGIDGTVMLCVLANLSLGAYLLGLNPSGRKAAGFKIGFALVLVALIPLWWRSNRDLLTTGVYASAYQYRESGSAAAPDEPHGQAGRTRPETDRAQAQPGVHAQPQQPAQRSATLLYYTDGLSATVAVYQDEAGERTLLINGKPDASTVRSGDMRTQLLLAHLPALACSHHPRNALVIGLGSGTTLGSLGLYPLERLDAVEIEPAVIEASKFFRDVNRDILQDPRVHLYTEDARRFIQWTGSEYDIITSEPSNLWMAGVANLFTTEFFTQARSKLSRDGVFCQWIHLYQISKDDVKCFLRTFSRCFPETGLFIDGPDMLVLGSNRPIVPAAMALRSVSAGVLADLQRAGFSGIEDVMETYMGGTRLVRTYSNGGPLNTDDRPVLEFTAARNVTWDYSAQIVGSVRAASRGPLRQEEGR